MDEKLRKIIFGVGTLIELGCIGTLAYIGLRRNQDAYEAEMKCINLEFEKFGLELENNILKREVAQLKENFEKEEES